MKKEWTDEEHAGASLYWLIDELVTLRQDAFRYNDRKTARSALHYLGLFLVHMNDLDELSRKEMLEKIGYHTNRDPEEYLVVNDMFLHGDDYPEDKWEEVKKRKKVMETKDYIVWQDE